MAMISNKIFVDVYSHGSQDSDSEYSRPRNTIITMQKPVAEHDYSVTGEHFNPLQRRRVEHPTS